MVAVSVPRQPVRAPGPLVGPVAGSEVLGSVVIQRPGSATPDGSANSTNALLLMKDNAHQQQERRGCVKLRCLRDHKAAPATPPLVPSVVQEGVLPVSGGEVERAPQSWSLLSSRVSEGELASLPGLSVRGYSCHAKALPSP